MEIRKKYTLNFKETGYSAQLDKVIFLADWTITANRPDRIMIEKFTKDGGTAKTFRVGESNEFAYQLKKSRINASGGAYGLIDFMERSLKDTDTWTRQIFNFCWDMMKETR